MWVDKDCPDSYSFLECPIFKVHSKSLWSSRVTIEPRTMLQNRTVRNINFAYDRRFPHTKLIEDESYLTRSSGSCDLSPFTYFRLIISKRKCLNESIDIVSNERMDGWMNGWLDRWSDGLQSIKMHCIITLISSGHDP